MQAARHFIAVIVKFTAGMQRRHDHFCRTDLFFWVHINGNASAIVPHRDRLFRVHGYVYRVAMSRQRFINGVVH